MKRILVIGSLNMDLVTHVSHLPKPGETISSSKFYKNPGGKGANQAIAAAKLGANVQMIGKVGWDDYGTDLLDNLRSANVQIDGVKREDVTGMAFINVSDEGENNIVLVPGANSKITNADIDQMKDEIAACDLIILQLEIPLPVVEYTLRLAKNIQKEVILNPAPAQKLSTDMLRMVHTLIPNETELEILTGRPVSTEKELIEAAQMVRSWGVKRIVVTLGSKGSLLINDQEQVLLPAYRVDAVDTTAAGDAYVGAFAIGITSGMSDQEAAKFASKVSAIVVTREGAQQSLPTKEEVDKIILSD
ncbi:ribokinase [Shimazuella kribbensis]|uniref:ribokinase n=1 Tax=Shimazuella kribbensis TaxID=139808 RepID=UPI00048BC1D3|nr:ribokinase [Shimazuella kribbensis]